MTIAVHFTVDELRGDFSHLERRLKNKLRDLGKYDTYHQHLMVARTYAVNGTLGDASHVYLKQDGVYCASWTRKFKGYKKTTKIS